MILTCNMAPSSKGTNLTWKLQTSTYLSAITITTLAKSIKPTLKPTLKSPCPFAHTAQPQELYCQCSHSLRVECEHLRVQWVWAASDYWYLSPPRSSVDCSGGWGIGCGGACPVSVRNKHNWYIFSTFNRDNKVQSLQTVLGWLDHLVKS